MEVGAFSTGFNSGGNVRSMWYLAHERYQWVCPSSSHLLLSLCPLDAKWYLFFPASLGFTENYTKCQSQQLVPVQFCQTGGDSQPLCPAARKPTQHLIQSECRSFPCRHHLRVRSAGPTGPLWNVNLTFFFTASYFQGLQFPCKMSLECWLGLLAKQCAFHMEFRCLGIVYINVRQALATLRNLRRET